MEAANPGANMLSADRTSATTMLRKSAALQSGAGGGSTNTEPAWVGGTVVLTISREPWGAPWGALGNLWDLWKICIGV